MMKPGLYCCIRNYQSPYPESILFQAGEVVAVGDIYNRNPEWQNWIRCQGEDGKEAWVPLQFLQVTGNQGIILRSYDARELTISENEFLQIAEIINGFGMAENQVGERGWVPLNHLVLAECGD